MSEFYCQQHRYNPPENSGQAFCPQCEMAPVMSCEVAEAAKKWGNLGRDAAQKAIDAIGGGAPGWAAHYRTIANECFEKETALLLPQNTEVNK